MAKTRDIKKRIKAVANIRRITKTMQMIATAKFAAASARATATKPYTEGVFALVTELGATAGDVTHPLIAGPASGSPAAKAAATAPMVYLIITSDRGLCGAYNGSVLRTAIHAVREAGGAQRSIELVGKKGAAFLRFNNQPIARQHTLGDKPSYESVERIAQDYMDRFIKGEIAGVRVAYMQFISAGRQAPAVMQLLPLKAPAKKAAPDAASGGGGGSGGGSKKGVVYEFSPRAEELLGELLPAAVKATLFQVVNDAVVSEHISRMVAMKAATDNAGKMGKLLTRKYNRARQAQITTELTEIVSGAAALE